MNLVGKIFVVVVIVFSLVLMVITMCVYTAQRNWREVVMLEKDKITAGKELGLKYQKDNLDAANRELKDQKDKLEKEYTAEKTAKQQSLTKLQNELDLAKKDRQRLETERAGLEKQQRDAIAAQNATQKNSHDYRVELEKQRTQLAEARKDRDEHMKQVVKLTDDLNQTVNDKEQLRKRMAELAKDLAKAEEMARYFNLPDKNSDYKSKAPPKVDAVVTNVNGDGLIEISLGSDAGLRQGHKLEVYRINGGQSSYVGRVEVVKTDPSKSVCKIDTKSQISNVMVNDRVASKIE
jgi:hypothetical protein